MSSSSSVGAVYLSVPAVWWPAVRGLARSAGARLAPHPVRRWSGGRWWMSRGFFLPPSRGRAAALRLAARALALAAAAAAAA